jgi:hypothetical protein
MERLFFEKDDIILNERENASLLIVETGCCEIFTEFEGN